MDQMKQLHALLKQVQEQIDAVANAKREANSAMSAMANLRVVLNDSTWSSGPTDAQKELLRLTKEAMRATLAQEHENRIRDQRMKSATAIDCLRADLCRLAALAVIELGQVAKQLREATHD